MGDPIIKSKRVYAAVLSLAVSGLLAFKGYTLPEDQIETFVTACLSFVATALTFWSKMQEGKK